MMAKHVTDVKPIKRRVDGQITGLAGEFFVAAELLKRNLQVSITFGMPSPLICLPSMKMGVHTQFR